MRLASVTLSCERESSAGIARIVSEVNAIMKGNPDVGLVFFGEMSTSFYDPGNQREYHRRSSLGIDSAALDPARSAAERHSVHLCFGLSELAGNGEIHNTQILLDPSGRVKALHRKRNLKRSELLAGYVPGEDPVTLTEVEGVRTAIVICSDAASLQTMKALRRSSPDLLLLSLADDMDRNWFMARCNAALYDSWIVTANRFGREAERYWNGHAVVSDPRGRIVQRSVGKEAVLLQDITTPVKVSAGRKLMKRAKIPFLVAGNPRAVLSYF